MPLAVQNLRYQQRVHALPHLRTSSGGLPTTCALAAGQTLVCLYPGPAGAYHAHTGLSPDTQPPLRPKTWMPAAREEQLSDIHTTNITLSASPTPLLLWLWCRCCVGVAFRRCSMISKVQGSKVQGSQGLIVFKDLNIPRFPMVENGCRANLCRG